MTALRAVDCTYDGYASPVVALDDPCANDPALSGAKAANIARARLRGLPALPGFVVTTQTSIDGEVTGAAIKQAWAELSGGGGRAVVVRSSSVAEDGGASSMAGMFTSVTGVAGWKSFNDAVERVQASAARGPERGAPMAVLVQPHLDAVMGGVMFGADPLTGRTDRIAVVAANGTPEALVSGRVDGTRYTLASSGRAVERRRGSTKLSRRQLRALAELSRRAGDAFGAPQDIEWAFDVEGRLWLLQSRPVTTTGRTARGTGPLLGPGPVAETFPDPLTPLERDLWVDPLRAALVEALRLMGTTSRRKLRSSPVLTMVGGRVAADLGLFEVTPKKSLLTLLDLRRPARRLLAGWRVGRLRAAMPALSAEIVKRTDDELGRIPPLAELSLGNLQAAFVRAKRILVALHGHEVVAGMLLPTKFSGATSASRALRCLATGRDEGLADGEIIRRYPEVLALSAPAIDGTARLPATASLPAHEHEESHPLADAREALRLRARWVQELGVRVALEIGRRAQRRGLLERPGDIRLLELTEVDALMEGSLLFPDLAERSPEETAPLPAAFRLAEDGTVVAEKSTGQGSRRGVSPGRAAGRVEQDAAQASGAILVVGTLDPDLASVLPQLRGLVAETGSVLSHLAILAREYGIPTVVGVPNARDVYEAGSQLLVDGTTGDIQSLDPAVTP